MTPLKQTPTLRGFAARGGGAGIAPAVLGLAVGGADTPSLTLFEGNGDGTFSAPLFELAVPGINGGFVDVVGADLNDDGQQDIVAATFADQKLVVALGDAPFHLADPEIVEIGARPLRLLLRDVTGDTALDALLGTETGIVLLRGRGDGSFAGAEGIASGDAVKDIALLDINGDAVLDLVAAVPRADVLRVYEGMRGDGFVAGPEVTIAQPLALAVGEFTSDTRLDVAVFAGRTAEVLVLRGTRGELEPPFVVASGIAANRLFTADVNGDARADLIANDTQAGRIHTLVGSSELPFAVVSTSVPPQTALVVADFDGDALVDLVTLPSESSEPAPLPAPVPIAPPPCQGDCNHDEDVGTDELIVAVRLALGDGEFTCSSLDRGGDLVIGIDDLIAAVENALSECSAN